MATYSNTVSVQFSSNELEALITVLKREASSPELREAIEKLIVGQRRLEQANNRLFGRQGAI